MHEMGASVSRVPVEARGRPGGGPDGRGWLGVRAVTDTLTDVHRQAGGQRTLRRVDVRTVGAFSLVFNLTMLITVLVTGIVLWVAASVLGAIGSLDHLINQAFGYQSFHLVGSELLLSTFLIGLVLVGIGTVVTVVMAVVYNLVSDVVGGLRFRVEGK